MSKSERMPNDQNRIRASHGYSCFDFRILWASSFVIRHYSLVRARSGQNPPSLIHSAKSESSFNTMSSQPPERKDVESAGADDAIIGRAFRRSLVVLLLVGAVVSGVSFLLERKPAGSRMQATEPDAPTSRPLTSNAIPVAGFVDI